MRGDCLACLAYFAEVTGRCNRTDLLAALVNATRIKATPDPGKRMHWWTAKLSNLQHAFTEAGLHGTELYGQTLKSRRGGRPG